MEFNMEKVNFKFSTKNVPFFGPESYTKRLIEMTEKFIRRMRWKAFFFLNPTSQTEVQVNYGFNSTNTPPPIAEMKTFEEKIENLIKNIEFRKRENKFQNTLKKEMKQLVKDNKILVKADKTSNYYKMTPKEYNNLLGKNIQAAYKKTSSRVCDDINREAKNIASKLKIDDRVDKTAEKEAFVTLKDHKPNFANKPTCRLINPAKSELGRASKRVLQTIVKSVGNDRQLNLWRNTQDVIEWFKNIDKNTTTTFICFDIVNFYPSITEELLEKSLKFASKTTTITEQEIELIKHTKKSLLFTNDEAWMKTSPKTQNNFDVTMGSYDGAETCELVGLFLLSELQQEHGNNIGLYRDDGLAALNKSPREVETIKKNMCKTFKKHNIQITIEANKKVVNYLDITLDLKENTFKPFKKPNDTPLYVNIKSNHPPSVKRNIPKGINKRLSTLSASKAVFDEAANDYQQALKNSGYNHKLSYDEQKTKQETGKNKEKKQKNKTKGRKRSIIWFNPPFDGTVKTNVGKEFFKILEESFPRNHKLHKIFNRNTIKLSYSCMPNIKQIIDSNNKKKLNQQKNNCANQDNNCNCRTKDQCPLQNKCQTQNIVYQATVTQKNTQKTETYIGMTETTFKTRYANHKQSFKHERYKNQTELSKHIWTLKENNIEYDISWKIVRRAKSYSPSNKRCNLCTTEKYFILCKQDMATLNSRVDMVNTCRHRRKFLLTNSE